MKHFTGYGAYLLFLALRTHFTNIKYDFFTMKGKVKANRDTFNKRNDRMFFEKLAKRYEPEELKQFYIANILEDRIYVTDMLTEEAHECYFKHMMLNQSLSYHFDSQIESLFSAVSNVKNVFDVSKEEYPIIVMKLLQKTIAIETVIILDDFVKFSEKFDSKLDNDILWSKLSIKLKKYRPFVKYDKKKLSNILKEKIEDATQ